MDLLFKIILVLFFQQFVLCQVCNETRSIFREAPETYRFSYIETYEEPCITRIFCSVKTRKSVNVTSRMVQRFENVTVNVCCDGYIEDDNHGGNGLYCKPVCNPPCQNGYCRRPNQCACEAGYALDPLDPHSCKPLCLEGCQILDCISTKTPQCFSNSTNTETTYTRLSPVCTEPCVNAKCVGPEICKCFPGYHQTSAYICEPSNYFATESCDNGTLVDPHTCLCNRGWQWKCGSCQPICDGCDYGTCVAPGQCECNHGYAMSNSRCEPYCSNGCENGRCVSPDHCSCDPGWYKTELGDCKAHCDMSCEYGDCVAPNVCECRIGYQLYLHEGISSCVPNSKDCEGSSDPISCLCDAPYIVRYFADNGSDCDCIGACLNSSSTCTKAICLFMDVGFDMFPPESNYDHDIDDKANKSIILEDTHDMKNYGNSTILTAVTTPKLDYDYDSYEEESADKIPVLELPIYDNETVTAPSIEKNESKEIMQANDLHNNHHRKIDEITNSTLFNDQNTNLTFSPKVNENTTIVNITKTLGQNNNDVKMSQKHHESSNLEGTSKAIAQDANNKEKNITDETNLLRKALNSNDDVLWQEKLIRNMHWIIGITVIAGLLLFFILVLIVKRKCSKQHCLTSPVADGGGETKVYYKSNVS